LTGVELKNSSYKMGSNESVIGVLERYFKEKSHHVSRTTISLDEV